MGNYGFKFDPNSSNNNSKEATLYGPERSKVTIEGNEAPLNMPENVVLANNPNKSKSRVRKIDTSMGPDIGRGSSGFAGIFTLACIIAVAGAIVAFLVFKY